MKLFKGCLALIFLGFASLVLLFALRDEFGGKEASATMAQIKAERIVRKSLKSPATAKFSGVTDSETFAKKLRPQVWYCGGFVDSQNSFGALIRNEWEIIAEFEGKNISDVLYLRVGKEEVGNRKRALKGQTENTPRAVNYLPAEPAKRRTAVYDYIVKKVPSALPFGVETRFATLQAEDGSWTICREIGEDYWQASGVVDVTREKEKQRFDWVGYILVSTGEPELIYLEVGS